MTTEAIAPTLPLAVQLLRIHDAETLQRLGALIDAVDPDGVIGAAASILAARELSEA